MLQNSKKKTGKTAGLLLLSFFLLFFTGTPLFAGGSGENNSGEGEEKSGTEAPAEGSRFEGFSVTDDLGRIVEFDKPINRIVSLAPSVTEVLYAAGADGKMAGVTTYCNFPPEAQDVAKIGGFSHKTISLETIISLSPDVVVGEVRMHEEMVQTLVDAGLKVVLFNADSFESVYEQILLAGKLTGDMDAARVAVESMKQRVEKVETAVSAIPDAERKKVFWEIYDSPLMTAGSHTFIGMILRKAGGINVFADLEGNWPKVSHEELLKRNPEVIVSSNSHGGVLTLEEIKARPGWSQLDAVREDRIYLIGEDIVSRSGPRLALGLETVASKLYPDLFK